MNKRYGVIIGASGVYGMYFDRETAEKHLSCAKVFYSDARIVEFNLVNDEGYSPYLVPVNRCKNYLR